MRNAGKVVILDTDLGSDVDDSWALAQLLMTAGLDLKLICVATGDVQYRAALVRRLLIAAGREDVPVALGRRSDAVATMTELPRPLPPKNGDPEAVPAMMKVIREAAAPVTVIEIAPCSNLGDLLGAAPDLAVKVDLVAMAGSINRGLTENSAPMAEYNVRCDVAAAQTVFAAPWHSFTLVPLDSCAAVTLPGNWVKSLADAPGALAREVGRQYLAWLHHWGYVDALNAIPGQAPISRTSPLFDTVAVHAAQSDDFLRFQTMRLTVDEKGFCRQSETARPVRVAIDWNDRIAYQESLARLLLAQKVGEMKEER